MVVETGRRSPLEVVRRTRRSWQRISPFLGSAKRPLSILAVCSVAAGLMEAALLALIAGLAATLALGDSRVDVDFGPVSLLVDIPVLFVIGFALALMRTVMQVLLAYLPARMSANATARLRRQVFEAFTGTSWAVQSSERDGHFQALVGGHVSHAAGAIIAVGQGISSSLVFLTLVGSAFALSVPTAIVLIIASAGLFLALQPLSRRLRTGARELSEEQVAFSKGIQDITRMAEETQVFGASASYRAQLVHLIDQVRMPYQRTKFLSRLVPVLYQSAALALLLVALVAVFASGATGLVSLGAVVLLLVRSMNYGQQLLSALAQMDQHVPFMSKLRDALDHYYANPVQDGHRPLPSIDRMGMVNVGFSYSKKQPVLSDVSFDVLAGEAIGLVGPSGAGKSTLVQLLLRLREPDKGMLHVNGEDARDFRRDDWQRRVAYVPQTPQLIHGSVADNIRFYRPWITDADVEQAARRAHIHDEIVSWSHGYGTAVGQRATAVSGGQRQRICLARALAGTPDILVLDEPTSALDVKSEMLVSHSLRELKGDVTMLLVAHRLSTLSMCDRVMVVIDGRLQAFEEPSVLAQTNGFYREAMQITRQQSAL